MVEVNVDSLYKVVITEYEQGWGQRVDDSDTKFFTTLEEAQAYKNHWEKDSLPDYYFRGEITKVG